MMEWEKTMLHVVLEGNKRSGLYDNDIPDAVSMIVATGLGYWVPVYVCTRCISPLSTGNRPTT